jgi:hypothetical protein
VIRATSCHAVCATAAPEVLVRLGRGEVPARLGRGEAVDAGEYTFRTSTEIETAAADLDRLNKGVFVSVAGRRPGGVVYETYLVG